MQLGAGVEALLRASTSSTGALLGANGPFGSSSILGTTTNDNASSGYVGEFMSSIVPVGSKVTLTSGVNANITTLALTAGDWDVTGNLWFTGDPTTNVSVAIVGTNNVSATFPASGLISQNEKVNLGTAFATGSFSLGLGPVRYSLASSTTVYLLGVASFTVAACYAYGQITARRIR